MKFSVDAVAFDLDGTLLDSRRFATDCVVKAFEELAETHQDLQIPSRRKIAAQIGKPSHQFCSALLDEEHAGLMNDLHERIAHLEDQALREGQGELFEGAKDVLETLCERGFRLLLVSNCSPSYLHAVSSCFDFEIYFDILDCAGEQYGKTKTDILRRGLRQVRSQASVMVGDRVHDMESARLNGCGFIACSYGFGTKRELADADDAIDDISELPALLQCAR